MRLLPVMRAGQSGEMFNETLETLRQEAGEIVKNDPLVEELDRSGLDALRQMK